MKKLFCLLSVIVGIGLSLHGQIPQSYPFQAPTPAGGLITGFNYTGNPGSTTYYYYLVTSYPGGAVPDTRGIMVQNIGNNAPSVSNPVQVVFNTVPNATNYTLLRVSSVGFPGLVCTSCVVGSGTTGAISDTGTSLTNLNASPMQASNANLTLDNIHQALPQFNFGGFSLFYGNTVLGANGVNSSKDTTTPFSPPASGTTLTYTKGGAFCSYNSSSQELCTGSGGGGGMVYPPAGVPLSTGTTWGSSYTVGSAANNLLQLNGSSQLVIGPIVVDPTLGLEMPLTVSGYTRYLHQTGGNASGDNQFFGASSGNASVTGHPNTAFGMASLHALTTGIDNSAFGGNSLLSLTSGQYNAALGTSTLQLLTTGNQNVGIGPFSAAHLTTGGSNVNVGYGAGDTSVIANANSTGSQNTFVGVFSGPSSSTQISNAGAFGYNAQPSASNHIVIGNGSVTDVYFGSEAGNANLHGNVSNSLPFTFTGYLRYISDYGSGTNINLFVGGSSGNPSATGNPNVCVGETCMYNLTTGTFNTGLGDVALGALTTGTFNDALGSHALAVLQTGSFNTVAGQGGMEHLVTSSDNSCIGQYCMVNSTDPANDNTCGGYLCLDATTGSYNVALGSKSSGSLLGGTNNVTIGYHAGDTATLGNANQTGSYDTFVGDQSGPSTTTQISNAFALGAGAVTAASNTGVIGNASVTDVYFGSIGALANIHAANLNSGVPIGGTITSGTAGSILYVNPSATLAQDNANLFYSSTGYNSGPTLQIGPRATEPIDAMLETYNPSGTNAHFHHTGAQGSGFANGATLALSEMDSTGGGGSGVTMASGSIFGTLQFGGQVGTSYTEGTGAAIAGFATQNWSAGNTGGKMVFYTVPNSSTTPTTTLTLNQDQSSVFAGSVTGSSFLVGANPVAITGADISTTNLVKQEHNYVTNVTVGMSPYTILSTDTQLLCNATAANVTLNLPASTGGGRVIYLVKTDSSTHSCFLSANGTDVINGSASTTASVQYSAVAIIDSTAGFWYVRTSPQGNGDWTGVPANNTVNIATNLRSGTIGQIPYQSAASTTAFLSGNTLATDQVLVSHGTGSAALAPTLSNAPALSTANMTISYLGPENNIGSGGASQTISCASGAVQSITLSANLTIGFTQPSSTTCKLNLVITQASSGGPYTVSWASIKWPGGIAPVMTAGASGIDVYSCLLDGTNTYCTAGQNFQ